MPRRKQQITTPCTPRLVPGVDCDFTVKEWCAKRRISEARFWIMHRNGDGPAVIQVGKHGRITITAEADKAWAARMTVKA